MKMRLYTIGLALLAWFSVVAAEAAGSKQAGGSKGSTPSQTPTRPQTPARRPPTKNPYARTPQVQPYTDYTIVCSDDASFRVLSLPTHDQEGKTHKYTAEEKKELKGPDSKVIGYQAGYDDITVGATLRVTVSRKKTDAEAAKSEKSKLKDSDKEKDSDKKDSDKKDSDKDTKEPSQWVKLGLLYGTVTKLTTDGGNKEFVLRVANADNPNIASGYRPPTIPTARPGQPGYNPNQPRTPQVVPADPTKPATLVVITSDAKYPLSGGTSATASK